MVTKMVRRRGAQHVTFVDSDSEAGKHYQIARLPDGTLACACISFVFSQETPKRCRHLRAYGASVTPPADGVQVFVQALAQPAAPARGVRVVGETFTFRRAISFGPVPAVAAKGGRR